MNDIIDVCGKKMPEYIVEILAKFNRRIDNLAIRAIGMNISKGVEIAHFLSKNFGVEIHRQEIKSFQIDDIETPYIEITLKGNAMQTETAAGNYNFPRSRFVDFPVYHLLLQGF